jgi:ankyrin repeat protein
MEEVNALMISYSPNFLQEAVLVRDKDGSLPIHVALFCGAPLEVIQLLLDNDIQKQMHLAWSRGCLPIHLALFCGAPLEVIQLLLDNDIEKKTLFVKDVAGRLPIHIACVTRRSVEIVKLLLESDPEKKTIHAKSNFEERLPIDIANHHGPVENVKVLLHFSIGDRIQQLGLEEWKVRMEELINAMTRNPCSDTRMKLIQKIYARLCKYEASTRNMPRALSNALARLLKRQTDSVTEDVNALIISYTQSVLQEAVLVRDKDGSLPIHVALYYGAPLEVIRVLLDNDTENKSIFEMDRKLLPIHIACEWRRSVEVVQMLLDSDPESKTIHAISREGRLPIDIVGYNNAPVEVVKLLLRVSIGDRIQQLGLHQWRIVMEELIDAMTEHDGKKTRVKRTQVIYARVSKYEEIGPSISLLALAIWRTSCLHWGDKSFQSMQEMEDLWAMDDAFDPVEYKRERRIKSGADVIIGGVLPFLPVDDWYLYRCRMTKTGRSATLPFMMTLSPRMKPPGAPVSCPLSNASTSATMNSLTQTLTCFATNPSMNT